MLFVSSSTQSSIEPYVEKVLVHIPNGLCKYGLNHILCEMIVHVVCDKHRF